MNAVSLEFHLTGAPPAVVSLNLPPCRPLVDSFPLALPSPGVAGLRLTAERPRVRSFQFLPAVERPATFLSPPHSGALSAGLCPASASSVVLATTTHVRPPQDVIKLGDRLLYVLQPPLESIVARGALSFPFQPFPYQLDGVAFLVPRFSAVLADEMGLGKSMQAITALRLLLHSGEIRSALVICPKPLVTNWQREFTLWAPELPVAVVEGDQTRRQWQWQHPASPVRIANYELLHRDHEWLAAQGTEFDLVILDEAQRIKNQGSSTAQFVRAIPRRRGRALTGTPVENSPADLVGIFEFAAPGHLSVEMPPRRLGRLAADYVLRRTKDKVLADLPPKLYRDAELELSPEQRETYRLAEEDGVVRLSEMGEAVTIQHVFELVLRLKQICNFDPASGTGAKFERLAADLEEVAASGRKAIVFSQWVETLETLRARLTPFRPLAYHGRVPQGRRDAVLKQFREGRDHHVLLLSYGAGGVGLNLQFCEYVFLFDRWWNPAVEDQAIQRAHRIGSAGPVTVSRFLTVDTIEERIDEILRVKRELFDTIFSDARPLAASGLTQEEVFGLFRLKAEVRRQRPEAA